jgi:HK97 family phage major capsid protein
MAGRIAQKVFETSPVRQIASSQTISTDSMKGPIDSAEASAGWVGEFTRLENTAFISGSGSKQPQGILSQTAVTTADATRAWGAVQYIVTGSSGAFPSSNPGDAHAKLMDVLITLKAAYRTGAIWLMNRGTLGTVMKERDDVGRPLWQPNLQADAFGIRLLGYPVVEAEDMPAIAADSYSVAFGNFREAYQIVDRTGIRILRDPFSAKPYVYFYAIRRTGGDAINREAYKILKFGTA